MKPIIGRIADFDRPIARLHRDMFGGVEKPISTDSRDPDFWVGIGCVMCLVAVGAMFAVGWLAL